MCSPLLIEFDKAVADGYPCPPNQLFEWAGTAHSIETEDPVGSDTEEES